MRESGNVVSEGRVVDLVYEEPEKGMGLVVWIGLEPRVDLDDERGRYCREETSLMD